MQFKNRISRKSYSVGDGNAHLGFVWTGLPRNPVFYPPTSGKDHGIESIADTQFISVATDEEKPTRLMARLKAMFQPKTIPSGFSSHALDTRAPVGKKRHLHRHSTQGNFCQRESMSKTSQRPPRLVARSPLREDSILADLCVLAEHGFVPRTTQPRRTTVQLAVCRSPTGTNMRSRSHPPNRAGLAALVCSPADTLAGHIAYVNYSCDSDRQPDIRQLITNSLLHEPHFGSIKRRRQGPARSISLMPPLMPSLPSPMSQYDDRCIFARTHRDSSSSDSTAALSLKTQINSPATAISEETDAPRISYSPSQRTLGVIDCSCTSNTTTCVCAEDMLPPLPLLGFNVLEGGIMARRPYSEGYSEHALLDTYNAGLSGRCPWVDPIGLCSGQRALYMRTSCAESELVKSTFDLAKLLPYAPQ
ncbi:hypothetical protein H4R24_001792 [Coemansia sp. RSA 988]|nr:hypothetical protein H4R24_001792 [Coemansia sp. RSA 988]